MQWEQIIAIAVVPIVVPLLLTALARGRASAGPGELRYARGLRWFTALLATVPPLAILIVLVTLGRPLREGEAVAFAVAPLAFVVVLAPLLLEFFRVQHSFDDKGLTFRSPWSRHRHIAWDDVASLKWRKLMKWLDIQTFAGTTVHLSPWLAGTQAFADVALARLPSVVLTAYPEARAVLKLMSAGEAAVLVIDHRPPERMLADLGTRERRD